MEMEMRAAEEIGIGEDITTPLPSLAFSLLDSTLSSHCSSCFSPLPPHPIPILPSFPSPSSSSLPTLYCSHQCSISDSPLHFSSAEHHLSPFPLHGDSSDLRLALRLLFLLQSLNLLPNGAVPDRISGLLTNRFKLTTRYSPDDEDENEMMERIRDGARAMAIARRIRDGLLVGVDEIDAALEEAVLCIALTNAVEVTVDGGKTLGVAIFGTTFSWINHSCSPNACYRFLLRESMQSCSSDTRSRIVPACGEAPPPSQESQMVKPNWELGPKLVVRSIKMIKAGESISVAYTDVLQPKTIRLGELWSKYRFTCQCERCSASPPTFVDHALQELSAFNGNSANLNSDKSNSDKSVSRAQVDKKLTSYIDNAISDYLTDGKPESCCEKLENLVTLGFGDSLMGEHSEASFRLGLFHHHSLNAYTALASAYKARSSELLASDPLLDSHKFEAFHMSRRSIAYSLLLAGATHQLFLSESSLIVHAASFWTSAGESLLGLARSSLWKLFIGDKPVERNPASNGLCSCSFMDNFKIKHRVFNSQVEGKFEEVSREFLDCISNISRRVWSCLIHGYHHLKEIEDPVDFSWLQARNGPRFAIKFTSKTRQYTKQDREDVFQLGVHCMLYGGYLSSTCYNCSSQLNHCIKDFADNATRGQVDMNLHWPIADQ
ncbi:SET domain [Dillenia turbinata]|uniref:SET domain n=1 Tax=Dillenia turbinata TaxID=194707 RepID=A0AAN8ZHS9_9MAGN